MKTTDTATGVCAPFSRASFLVFPKPEPNRYIKEFRRRYDE